MAEKGLDRGQMALRGGAGGVLHQMTEVGADMVGLDRVDRDFRPRVALEQKGPKTHQIPAIGCYGVRRCAQNLAQGGYKACNFLQHTRPRRSRRLSYQVTESGKSL